MEKLIYFLKTIAWRVNPPNKKLKQIVTSWSGRPWCLLGLLWLFERLFRRSCAGLGGRGTLRLPQEPGPDRRQQWQRRRQGGLQRIIVDDIRRIREPGAKAQGAGKKINEFNCLDIQRSTKWFAKHSQELPIQSEAGTYITEPGVHH